MSSIRLRDVTVEFPIYQGSNRSLKKMVMGVGGHRRLRETQGHRVVVQALQRVNLEIRHGDRVGLIGPNGAGKTTLLRVMGGVYEPVAGEIAINGRVAPLFDIHLGLNMDATGYENILFRGLYMGMSPSEIRQHIEEIAAFTELGEFLSMPMRTYSSGMQLRLAFAVATCATPEILLMDEWVLAGDAQFFEKARQRLSRFVNQSNILVLASHNEQLLLEWCTKAVYMANGQVQAFGPVREVLAAYHPAALVAEQGAS